jgi:hypothetical protein
MRVAVLGAGSVGTSLAAGLRRGGHEVAVGVRSPKDGRHSHVEGVTSIAGAVGGAAAVVLAVPVGALEELVPSLPLSASQVVVDATNAVAGPVPGGADTVGAFVRSLVPDGVAVVKAFNTIGAEHLGDGRIDGARAFLPVAGDAAGLGTVVDLARGIGFDAVALGGMDAVGMVESHARLWIHLMRSGWGRDFGFAVVGAPARAEAG